MLGDYLAFCKVYALARVNERRIASGQPPLKQFAPPLWWIMAAYLTLQYVFSVRQELAEADNQLDNVSFNEFEKSIATSGSVKDASSQTFED